jgi:chromosome segregation ATPase
MDKEFKCEFCKSYFVSKTTLSEHQKTAKFCLNKRGEKNEEIKCNYCDKVLTTHQRLNTHLNICKVKLKEINEEKNNYTKSIIDQNEKYVMKLKEYETKLNESETKLNFYKETEIKMKEYEIKLKEKEEYISKLEELLKQANQTIHDIAKQPKTVQTNTNSNNDNRIKTQNNLSQVFDINDIKKINNVLEKHLTPDVLAKGQKGVAEMLKEHLLKNDKGELIYECTDVSRQKFEFINTYGFVEPDPKANKLIKSLNDANIFDVAHSTGKKLWEKDDGVDYDAQHVHMPKVGEVLEINMDSSKLRSHLANITAR